MTSLNPAEFSPPQALEPFCSHVLVIGGGASGALMALHLLKADPSIRVSVIEKREILGCGIAYATSDPGHLLNTRVHNMSAFNEEPDHFHKWLQATGRAPGATPDSFVGRRVYGRYLTDLIETEDEQSGRMRCVRGECLRLEEIGGAVIAHLDDGSCIRGDRAILATGHAVPAQMPEGLADAWDFTLPEDPAAEVVIIGTGLSMVDHVISLLRNGHRGPITCISRRGLLPQVHADGHAQPVSRGEVPLGASAGAAMRWLRGLARQAEQAGGSWRDAVDGIRPHVSAIWRAWPEAERRRFLRHAASFWEVHRHRLPPESGRWLADARARGQLRVLRGRFQGAEAAPGHTCIRIGTAGGPVTLRAARAIDCRGIRRDPERDSAPVVRDLLARGACRLDALRLGIDTDLQCRVLMRDGRASRRILAIGPCARGASWEITAIPDIRVQCAQLAAQIATESAAPARG